MTEHLVRSRIQGLSSRSMRDLFPFLLLILLPALGLAQGSRWGPRAGVVLGAQTVGDLGANVTEWKPGLTAGISGDHPLVERFHLQTDLLWIMKGARARNPAVRTTGNTTLNYLELDLLGKFDLDGAQEGLFLTIGPTFGYFLSGRVTTRQDGQEINSYSLAGGDLYRRFEIGGAVGIGLEVKRWVLEFRGQSGVSTIDRPGLVRNVVLGAHFSRYLGA